MPLSDSALNEAVARFLMVNAPAMMKGMTQAMLPMFHQQHV